MHAVREKRSCPNGCIPYNALICCKDSVLHRSCVTILLSLHKFFCPEISDLLDDTFQNTRNPTMSPTEVPVYASKSVDERRKDVQDVIGEMYTAHEEAIETFIHGEDGMELCLPSAAVPTYKLVWKN
eukprot:gb/GECG01009839.1/.p1 GENE.gb/GECG01009839.1/~~gb/GECG01009839.1/.p1  ORF type:complete len:127 (+),score=18.25 gb/GECG01009839.1/:1-381(+)